MCHNEKGKPTVLTFETVTHSVILVVQNDIRIADCGGMPMSHFSVMWSSRDGAYERTGGRSQGQSWRLREKERGGF